MTRLWEIATGTPVRFLDRKVQALMSFGPSHYVDERNLRQPPVKNRDQ
ncbi:hypothetical protein [Rhizobium leguminosarum]|nr:hypothetical protein [Rhizobium leguminosarum]